MQRHNHVQLPSTVKEAAANLATIATRSKFVGHTKSAQNYGERLAAWLGKNPGVQTALLTSLIGGGLGAAGAGLSEATSEKKRKNYLSRMLTGGLLGAGVGGLGGAALHYSPEIMSALGISGPSDAAMAAQDKMERAQIDPNAEDPTYVPGSDTGGDGPGSTEWQYRKARKTGLNLGPLGHYSPLPALGVDSPMSLGALATAGGVYGSKRPFSLLGDLQQTSAKAMEPHLSGVTSDKGHAGPFQSALTSKVKKMPWYKRIPTALGGSVMGIPIGGDVKVDYDVPGSKKSPATQHSVNVPAAKVRQLAGTAPRNVGIGRTLKGGLGAMALGEILHQLSGGAQAGTERALTRSKTRRLGQ